MSNSVPPGADILKIYRCRFCKVRVISKDDTRAVLGKTHAKHCRRSKKQ